MKKEYWAVLVFVLIIVLQWIGLGFHDFPPFLRNLRFIDDFKRMRMFLYTLNIYHAFKK